MLLLPEASLLKWTRQVQRIDTLERIYEPPKYYPSAQNRKDSRSIPCLRSPIPGTLGQLCEHSQSLVQASQSDHL